MSAVFDYIQTFYVVPDSLNGSTQVMLSSIDLFFRAKPSLTKNITGSQGPSISVWICAVENNQPIPEKVVKKSITSVDYDHINTAENAESSTNVAFNQGVMLKAGNYYGIVVKYSDPAFEIWTNKQGDNLIDSTGITNNISSGSQGRFEGILYKATNSNDYLPLSDRDLKFKIYIAKFVETSGQFKLVNRAYEFLSVASTQGAFIGGETVYQNDANKAGTITLSTSSPNVIGVGTDFTQFNTDQHLVLNHSGRDVIKIDNIANSTFMTLAEYPSISGSGLAFTVSPVAQVYHTDYTQGKVYLVNSNAANSTFKFDVGKRFIGERSGASANNISVDRYKVDNFTPKFLIANPSSSEFNISYSLTDQANNISSQFRNIELLKNTDTGQDSYILSRSREVIENNMYGPSKKSAVVDVQFNVSVSNNNLFSVPYIDADELDFYVYQNDINNVYTETRYGIADYDTEIEKNGLAKSKWFSKKVTFDVSKSAEDIRVYATAYRPSGTEIRVYAKIHNSADKETFDDKFWTPLELKENIDRFSGADESDLIEYTYGFPESPETLINLNGTFTTTNGSAIIPTTIDQSGSLVIGDLIRIYDPITTSNHEEFIVDAVNSSSITVNRPVDNINLIGSMYVDKLKYKNTAWNNINNDNIVRYVSTAGVEFDTFTTMQIKVVYLAEDSYIVPKMEMIQAIGVSA